MIYDEIELSSLILIIVVVVCSYGLALILSLTCWNAYRWDYDQFGLITLQFNEKFLIIP